MATVLRLNADDDMLSRMEQDLVDKVQLAVTAAGIAQTVYGVFSIDDLENKTETDLCQKIGVGVAYAGAEPTRITTNPKDHLNVAGGQAAKTIDYIFQIILAVPTGKTCDERAKAAKLLTVLRRRILGTHISGDLANRTWAFAREGPNIPESTDTMLYYAQVWRVAVITVGPIVT